ncbi:MAG: hypothetical protein IRY98_01940 [Alicyclobacillaceae bacterium]|nr:hypothetical protein [Alicyclobacillaceae bacterium]
MDELHLVYCAERTIYGQTTGREPSRFLSEIPKNLLEHRRAQPETAAVSPGDRIVHAEFGEGIVLAVIDKGKEVEWEVMFHPSIGMKRISPGQGRVRLAPGR